MKLTEKMSYVKGYLEALEVEKDSKDWSFITKIVDLMDEMVAYIEDLQNQVDQLSDVCDGLDEGLGDLEDSLLDVYNMGEFDQNDEPIDYYDDDDQLYETTCPTCGKTIVLDELMLAEGGIQCTCGENLEFDFEGSIDDEENEDDIKDLDSLDAD